MTDKVLTNRARLARLDKFVREKRIMRGQWWSMQKGRERACLVAALAPEVADEEGYHGIERCPASVIPMWLAQITVDLDDRVTKKWWPEFLRQYAKTLRRIHVLTEKKRWTAEDWRRQDYFARASTLRLALRLTEDAKQREAVSKVVDYCERAGKRRDGSLELPHGAALLANLERERKSLLRLIREARTSWPFEAVEAAHDAIVTMKHCLNLRECATTVTALSLTSRYGSTWTAIGKAILGNLNKRCAELEHRS